MLARTSTRFHDLRHTHASHLLAAEVNVKVVSRRLATRSAGQLEPGIEPWTFHYECVQADDDWCWPMMPFPNPPCS